MLSYAEKCKVPSESPMNGDSLLELPALGLQLIFMVVYKSWRNDDIKDFKVTLGPILFDDYS